MNMNENQLNNSMEAVENMDMNKQVFEKDSELASDTEDVLHEFANPNAVIEEVTGCETVLIRDKNPNDNRLLFHKKGKEQEKKTRTVAEEESHYKVLRIIEDGSVALVKGHNSTWPEKTKKQIWGKKLTIERFTNEANFLVDDSLFLLSKDERRIGTYVEKLKLLLDEVKADMPNPASRNTGDVLGGIFSISKPNQVDVKNPTKAVNKEEHLKKGEHLKSEREKAIKVKAKAMKVFGYCQEKTNKHTKTTCPKNPKARK
ncbi:hypothetical protein Tco_0102837 [Tanacetum coccineum]